MEEKELIKRIKNSFKAGKSQGEILSGLQSRGYRVEYADALIKKSRRGKTLLYVSLIVVLIVGMFASLIGYLYFFQSGEKQLLENPLSGYNINFGEKSTNTNDNQEESKEIYLEDINITPDFLSYLLNEIGAWQLHSNPLNGNLPIINFKIDEKEFNSIIDEEILTSEGLSTEADLQFNTNKEDIVKAILSDSPSDIFKNSVSEGGTTIDQLAEEATLFSKGYLKLYDSLK